MSDHKLLPGFVNHVALFREKSQDYGTVGRVYVANKFYCYSLELPWRDNLECRSCIPAESYLCRVRISPRFGRKLYEVEKVEDRTEILIHSGNHAGNVDRNLKTDVEGCILLGSRFGFLDGQNAILNSRKTTAKFESELKQMPFILHIY